MALCRDVVLHGRRDTGLYAYLRSCLCAEYGRIEPEFYSFAFHVGKADHYLCDADRAYRGTDFYGLLYKRIQKEGLYIPSGKYINVIRNAL